MLSKIPMAQLGKLFNGSLQSAGLRLDMSPASVLRPVSVSAIALLCVWPFFSLGGVLLRGWATF